MKLKYILVLITALSLALSGATLAKKPEGKGNPHQGGSNAHREKGNRQSDAFSHKGRKRAEERHHWKELKKHKKSKGKKHKRDRKEYYDYEDNGKYDQYERQRYEEKYRNNPINTVIDRNVNDAKSKIDSIYRKAQESIYNKSRELTGENTHREKANTSKSWWSTIFGGE